jgi:hypothetical protein
MRNCQLPAVHFSTRANRDELDSLQAHQARLSIQRSLSCLFPLPLPLLLRLFRSTSLHEQQQQQRGGAHRDQHTELSGDRSRNERGEGVLSQDKAKAAG